MADEPKRLLNLGHLYYSQRGTDEEWVNLLYDPNTGELLVESVSSPGMYARQSLSSDSSKLRESPNEWERAAELFRKLLSTKK